jgi:hypothetical protein
MHCLARGDSGRHRRGWFLGEDVDSGGHRATCKRRHTFVPRRLRENRELSCASNFIVVDDRLCAADFVPGTHRQGLDLNRLIIGSYISLPEKEQRVSLRRFFGIRRAPSCAHVHTVVVRPSGFFWGRFRVLKGQEGKNCKLILPAQVEYRRNRRRLKNAFKSIVSGSPGLFVDCRAG